MICLVFQSEEVGVAAKKKIWVNRVHIKAAEGNYMVGDYSKSYTSEEVSRMTGEEVYLLDIYGEISGRLSTQTKGSEEWANLRKCYEIDQWYVKKPPEEFMDGVAGYTEEEFDPAWFPDPAEQE